MFCIADFLHDDHDFVPDERRERADGGYEPFKCRKICGREHHSRRGNFDYGELKNNTERERNTHHEVAAFKHRERRFVGVAHSEHMEEFAERERGERHRLSLMKNIGSRNKAL